LEKFIVSKPSFSQNAKPIGLC